MTRSRWQSVESSVESSDRDKFNITRVVFFAALHLGVLAVIWQTTWKAIGVAVLLHVICGGFGVCVGYHRLLTHRSFKCPKFLEYAFALAGSLSMQGGALEWVALHRKHHQHSDKDGDPHSATEGFWWSHMLWVLHTPTSQSWREIRRRYTPDLEKQFFYRLLERTHYLGSILLGVGLYFLGGWPFVVWGLCVRLVATYHITWFVNSASHLWGYRSFVSDDQSTNNWWVALLSYGEGWHNNHHAFPTSARHGLRPWEIDFSYYFIRALKAVGLAWDLYVPSPERMKEKLVLRADEFTEKISETAEELKEKFSETADELAVKFSETADELKEKLSETADELAEKLSPPTAEEPA
ncbi:MAG TPA: fatty acid desaturase [Terriglobales bacterium]|nr:fatty acid desaturase [Terriglobales bacterium]